MKQKLVPSSRLILKFGFLAGFLLLQTASWHPIWNLRDRIRGEMMEETLSFSLPFAGARSDFSKLSKTRGVSRSAGRHTELHECFPHARLLAEPDAEAAIAGALGAERVFGGASKIHGWGVFAGKDFNEGDILHQCPGRLLRRHSRCVADDVFGCFDESMGEGYQDFVILGLGLATLHNHASDPNAYLNWRKSDEHGGLIVGTCYAFRHIPAGAEIYISYGDDWFPSRGITLKEKRQRTRLPVKYTKR